jgi:hypothetical protein
LTIHFEGVEGVEGVEGEIQGVKENHMDRIISTAIIALLIAQPALASQKNITPAMEAAAFKQMAAAIPVGSRVKLQTMAGRRMTATLIAVDDDGVIVKRASRLPEPAMTIPFSELARLERDQKGGFSLGKAIGVGLAAGAGAILTLFFIALSIDD